MTFYEPTYNTNDFLAFKYKRYRIYRRYTRDTMKVTDLKLALDQQLPTGS